MSGHTPGPWVYGVRRDGSIWLSMGDRERGPHRQADCDFGEANARLIAAAPDLLAALEMCRGNVGGAIEPAIEAAIAKAKGE